MTFFRLILLALVLTVFATCGDDDEMTPPCAPTNWAGTYSGTANCNGIEEAVTVTVAVVGTDSLTLTYETQSRQGNFGPLLPNACRITLEDMGGPISTSFSAQLDGDEITLMESVDGIGGSFTCDISATRQ